MVYHVDSERDLPPPVAAALLRQGQHVDVVAAAAPAERGGFPWARATFAIGMGIAVGDWLLAMVGL